VRAHEIVDRALEGRAVVAGSLPPQGRDLDILVRSADDIAAVERALGETGFETLGGSWLRFAHMTAELVELIPAAGLGLGPRAREALFSEAIPLAGCERLARPSPAHAVLLLARQVADAGELAPKRRRRLEAALEEDPAAWRRAEVLAVGWGGPAALEALARLRARPAAAGATRGLMPSGVRARLGAMRDAARGRPRGAVIALSGLDGSGKSTQADALADALGRLGHAAAVEWTRIATNERLPVSVRPGGPWATATALENVWSQRRRIGGFLARGYVVVCDRYTLDSIVSLRGLVDEGRHLRLQRVLLRALVRRPAAAFWLEVRPETAWERKGEHGLRWLRRHHALYREEHGRLGVTRLDGERPPEELAALIARRAWRALGSP
jgi:thymidylate kinase